VTACRPHAREPRAALAKKKPIVSEGAPAPVASYSQAIKAGKFLFCSGQIPLDPRTGTLVTGGIEAETERVLENLGAVLASAGAGFQDVLKCTVFLIDLADFTAMNGVYSKYFGDVPPARSTVQVAALPRGARVEIEAIALVS
jgi:2-iminobutanoate/2-iminopropanoate deaminase